MTNLKSLCRKYFYHDRAKVYRGGITGGWKTGELSLVYEDLPCHLAIAGLNNEAHRDDRAQQVTINLRLDCSPEYDILENDVIEVATVHGENFNLVAGVAKKFFSHQQIDCKRRKESRQN